MKQKKQNYDEPNSIEQKAKELFGYDEDSLRAEMDQAERAWEAEKAADPEAEAKIQREADEGFEKLMNHIKEKGIQPISEEEYEKEQRKYRQEAVTISHGKKKVLLLVAAICVLGVGMTMVVSANREFKFNVYPMQEKQNQMIKQNVTLKINDDELRDAYKAVDETLGIKVLILGHKPDDMQFRKITIDEEHAVLEFDYGGESIFLKEEKYVVPSGVTQADVSDRKVIQSIENKWIGKTILLEQNVLASDKIEFSADISTDEACFYICGIMEKEEFIKLLQGLCYQ